MQEKLRQVVTNFFEKEGFVYRQYHPGSDGSDCCENALTAYTFKSHGGETHFLPQTRQLRMEYDIRSGLYDKVWTWDWSHRNEDRYGDGRHERFFPLVEFECRGEYLHELIRLEKSFLNTVAAYFTSRPLKHVELEYKQAIKIVGAKWGDDISPELEEALLKHTNADCLYIFRYPEELCHFTMAQGFVNSGPTGPTCLKVDVILPHGGETIGSAVRSVDPDYLSRRLYESDMYSGLVALGMDKNAFEPYFKLDLKTPALGGGVGITRLEKWIRYHLIGG